MTRTDLKKFTLAELEAFLSGKGKERFRATQIFKWLYQKDARSFAEMTNLSKDLRAELEATACISNLEPAAVEVGSDGTRKYLFLLEDGSGVESVVIPDEGRNTLCISSQAGCAMGCEFCLTGTYKLTRNLTTAEIVNQVMAVKRDLALSVPALPVPEMPQADDDEDDVRPGHPNTIRNIVLMGMGEPLHNLDNVVRALRIMLDGNGLQFSNRRVTVSTCGLVPEMARLGREVIVNLAISLNATTDELRDRIMPVNRRYPLKVLLQACREFPLPSRRKLTFEYVLLGGLNDTLADARRLLKLIHGIPSKVNLIPFNEWPGAPYKRSSGNRIHTFADIIYKAGYASPIRTPRGEDIMAACGQLKSATERRRKSKAQVEAEARA